MTIYIVCIEPISTRYTQQWYDFLPLQLKEHVLSENIDNIDIVTIDGGPISKNTTPGAFLNFAATNKYKAEQQKQIADLFERDQVKEGDYFLYTDAWNPTIIQTRYMLDLLGIRAGIGALWHAGSYDINDFLGRSSIRSTWGPSFENSLFSAIDQNFFATQEHIDLFCSQRQVSKTDSSICKVGWPMEYLKNTVKMPSLDIKENIIAFPHRISEEKQPDLVKKLEVLLQNKGYTFVYCQETCNSKEEYYNVLSKAKLVISANLQETLGIGCYEGMLYGAKPLMPDRLTYPEMYPENYLYPSELTLKNATGKDLEKLALLICDEMEKYSQETIDLISEDLESVSLLFDGKALYSSILDFK